MNPFGLRTAIGLLVSLAITFAQAEAVIWDGPPIDFSKAGLADPSLAENQDRLTDNVWITRGSTRGLYNANQESFQSDLSPVGTLWAVGTTADLESLTFAPWLDVFGLGGPFGGPPGAVGEDFVLQLTAENIYIDLQITSWGQGLSAGGAFSYTRSTEPPVLGLPGDFDDNGIVEAVDYSVMREGLGGEFSASDFNEWRDNYGATAAGSAQAAPEPASLALIALAISFLSAGRARR